MDNSVYERVVKIIVDTIDVKKEDVNVNASFVEDLGADSLDLVELVMAFEEEFEVEIPDDDVEKIKTVGQAVEYIEEKKSKASV